MITAVIAGVEGWEGIEDFGEDNLEWLQQYDDFSNGIPIHDTVARVMGIISAKRFQKCFSAWMKNCHKATNGEVIAIDGKSLRGTKVKKNHNNMIHMVSGFSVRNPVVLGQVKHQRNPMKLREFQSYKTTVNPGCLSSLMRWGVSVK